MLAFACFCLFCLISRVFACFWLLLFAFACFGLLWAAFACFCLLVIPVASFCQLSGFLRPDLLLGRPRRSTSRSWRGKTQCALCPECPYMIARACMLHLYNYAHQPNTLSLAQEGQHAKWAPTGNQYFGRSRFLQLLAKDYGHMVVLYSFCLTT